MFIFSRLFNFELAAIKLRERIKIFADLPPTKMSDQF